MHVMRVQIPNIKLNGPISKEQLKVRPLAIVSRDTHQNFHDSQVFLLAFRALHSQCDTSSREEYRNSGFEGRAGS